MRILSLPFLMFFLISTSAELSAQNKQPTLSGMEKIENMLKGLNYEELRTLGDEAQIHSMANRLKSIEALQKQISTIDLQTRPGASAWLKLINVEDEDDEISSQFSAFFKNCPACKDVVVIGGGGGVIPRPSSPKCPIDTNVCSFFPNDPRCK